MVLSLLYTCFFISPLLSALSFFRFFYSPSNPHTPRERGHQNPPWQQSRRARRTSYERESVERGAHATQQEKREPTIAWRWRRRWPRCSLPSWRPPPRRRRRCAGRWRTSPWSPSADRRRFVLVATTSASTHLSLSLLRVLWLSESFRFRPPGKKFLVWKFLRGFSLSLSLISPHSWSWVCKILIIRGKMIYPLFYLLRGRMVA